MNRSFAFSLGLALSLVACGDDDALMVDTGPMLTDGGSDASADASPDAQMDAGSDAADATADVPMDVPAPDAGPYCPEDDGSMRSVVVAAYANPTNTVHIYSVNTQGLLFDSGIDLTVPLPQRVTTRGDGAESLVAYGSSTRGVANGVAVIDHAADGSSASITQMLEFDEGFGPQSITYLGDDIAVIARIGGGDDNIVVIRRGPDAWTAEAPLAVPDEWPHSVRSVGDGQGLLLRAGLVGMPGPSQVIPIDASGDATTLGTPVDLPQSRRQFLYARPDGTRAYVPGPDPDAMDRLNPGGLLHSLNNEGALALDDATYNMPAVASLARFNADGSESLWLDTILATFELGDGTVVTEARSFGLYPIRFDETGAPMESADNAIIFPASVANDFVWTGDVVVVSRDGGTAAPEFDESLMTFVRMGEAWTQVCQPIDAPAPARLGVAGSSR